MSLITWENKSDLKELDGKIIRLRFYLENADLFSFWISKWITGQSYGSTAGGGQGLSSTGWDIPIRN